MIKKLLLGLMLIFIVVGVVGCAEECVKPYIQVGDSCCLDKNDNSVCDNDENLPEDQPEILEEPETVVEEPEEQIVLDEPEVEEEDNLVEFVDDEEQEMVEETKVEEAPEEVVDEPEVEEEPEEELSVMGKHPLYVTVFDITDGNAVFMQTPNDKNVLINVGPRGLADLLEFRLKQNLKVNKIDYMLFTDLEEGNAGASAGLLNKFGAVKTYDNGDNSVGSAIRNYNDALSVSDTVRVSLQRDQEIQIDPSIKLEAFVVYDTAKRVDGRSDKIVYKVTFRGFSMLFTGDCTSDDCEQHIMDADLDSDVMMVGHHGSKKATSVEFIEAVSPKVAIIQDGENAYLGVINGLKDSGATVYDTYKENENIKVTSNGASFNVDIEK